MCGFVGYFYYCDGRKEPLPIDKMRDVMSYRGPDEFGTWRGEGIALGHRRLSVIDLKTGSQPMHDVQNQGVIAYNGEVYNYLDLKDLLRQKGRRFRTDSDTEVVLNACLEFGKKAPEKMNGIFGYSFWDGRNRTLQLARDAFGVKPVYYYDSGSLIIFASEVKAILASGAVKPELDFQAVNDLLTYSFVPSPLTLFRGIKKLAPGSGMLVDSNGPRLFSYEKKCPAERMADQEEIEREYLNELGAAVKRQMMADVPVGISLSGGIDSAAVTHFAAQNNTSVKTFTVAFEGGDDQNEFKAARETAELYGTDHSEYLIKTVEYRDFFEKSLYHLEEPIGTMSALANNFVARMAKGKVKVLLSGQGADEPLAGYPRYVGEKISRYMRVAPGPVRELLNGLGRLTGNERLKRAACSLDISSDAERFAAIHTIFPESLRRKIIRPDFYHTASSERIQTLCRNSHGRDSLTKLLYTDCRFSLSDNLLLCNDKMYMAESIEGRVPFLDVEFMNFLEALPSDMKFRGVTPKYIHKKALGRIIPERITNRKKIGFAIPLHHWLRTSLADWTRDLLFDKDSLCAKVFRPERVKRLISLDQKGVVDYKRNVFLLVSLEMWYRTFFGSSF